MDSILDYPEESERSPPPPSHNFDLSTSLLASQPKSLARYQLRQSHPDYTMQCTMLPGIGQAEEREEIELLMEEGWGTGMEAVDRAILAASGPSQHQDQVEILDFQFEDGSITPNSSRATELSLSHTPPQGDDDDLLADSQASSQSSLIVTRNVTPPRPARSSTFDSPALLADFSPTARLSFRSRRESHCQPLDSLTPKSDAAQKTPSSQMSLRKDPSSSQTAPYDLASSLDKDSTFTSTSYAIAPVVRSDSPAQEEMDAFFGFVDLNAPSAATPSSSPTIRRPHRRSCTSPSSRRSTSRAAYTSPARETSSPCPQPTLQAVNCTAEPRSPGISPTSIDAGPSQSIQGNSRAGHGSLDDELSQDPIEKRQVPVSGVLPSGRSADSFTRSRLVITSSLQRIALSVLEQIHLGVRNLASPLIYTNLESASTISVGKDARSIGAAVDEQYSRKSIEVVLAKRGGRPAGETSSLENATPSSKKQKTTFPRKLGKGTSASMGGRGLACILRVVELLLEGLIEGRVSTKRDLYYRDVALFCRQQTVDGIIEDLAATLRIRRSDLNVVASSKGLFSGSLKLVMVDGSERDGSVEGSPIPPTQLIERIEANDIEWVLVVEKDAVLQTLSTGGVVDGDDEIGKGVLITGKGYPDVATRELVKRLADDLPSVPIMFLVDADPYGIEIMSTYVLGSSALSHDSSNLAIALERTTWLGVKPTHWDNDGVAREDLLLLDTKDRKKAISMCKRDWLPEEWRRELEYMLHLNRKAEIETLASSTKTRLSTSRSSVDDSQDAVPQQSSTMSFVRAGIVTICEQKA
ncbi:hypothetical protein JCM5353_007685 [Sporobolomyces roseus]